MIVRPERPADNDAVREIHRAAFGGGDDVVEARLVDELREDAGFLPHLSLVAEDGGRLLGHVIATRGRLEPLGIPALGLGRSACTPTSDDAVWGRRSCAPPPHVGRALPGPAAVRPPGQRHVPLRRAVQPALIAGMPIAGKWGPGRRP